MGRSGLRDWLVQRISGGVLLAWFLSLGGILLAHPDLDFATWREALRALPMRILGTATALSIAAHAEPSVLMVDFTPRYGIEWRHDSEFDLRF